MPSQRYLESVSVGDELPPLRDVFTPRRLVMFAGAATDFYEIHYDRDYAASLGLDGLLVHGLLKNALLGRFLHEWVAPAGRIVAYGCEYRGMDAPGEELVCRGVVTAITDGEIDLEIGVEKVDGTVTTPGFAKVRLPSRPTGVDQPRRGTIDK
jgi:acyl dehydratase